MSSTRIGERRLGSNDIGDTEYCLLRMHHALWPVVIRLHAGASHIGHSVMYSKYYILVTSAVQHVTEQTYISTPYDPNIYLVLTRTQTTSGVRLNEVYPRGPSQLQQGQLGRALPSVERTACD